MSPSVSSDLNTHSQAPAVAVHDGDVQNIVPVIIVGAGPVGLLLALRLAQSGIHCVVLEKDASLSQLPRAIGYYGPVHDVFKEVGLFDQIAAEGMASGGYVWRKLPTDIVDEAQGTVIAKELGSILGKNIMSTPDANGRYTTGHYSIQLAQCRLAEIFLEEAKKSGLVDVRWEHQVMGLTQNENSVTVTAATGGTTTSICGQYLAACDGSRSTVRKLLGLRLSGHSWPERFLAIDLRRTAPVVPEIPVHFTVDETFWGVVTPLEHVEAGKPGMWRYSLAVPALPTDGQKANGTNKANGANGANDAGTATRLTDEQVVEPAYVDSLLLRHIDGPRPSDHVVVRKSLYKMHQLLVNTMYRGRCFLAGDSAHINNPIGGLGLCTGLLDADALAQTLELALENTNSTELEALFIRYSAERRWVFQNVIHPFSTANKTRLHGASPENTAREDWYFQALIRNNEAELENIHRPLYEQWRTDMCAFWSNAGEGPAEGARIKKAVIETTVGADTNVVKQSS